MKKLYTIGTTAILLLTIAAASAQDIPLFTQKLTNSFLYNPAVAGNGVGSLTYAYRQSYSGITNAPRNNFISAHTPIANHKAGLGLNFYQEDVNFMRNSYVSAAFAYHLHFGHFSTLSMGISGEYNFMGVKKLSNSDVTDPDYLKLAGSQLNDYDFSFGLVYQSKYFKAGIAANRLASEWIKEEDAYVLSSYYSGFLQGTIPLRGGSDLLEPTFFYRKLSETNSSYDAGLYYTYNARLMAGASLRKGSVAGFTAGLYITPKLMVGYTREMYFSDVQSQVGATNEFTLKLNFKEYDYRKTFTDSYKSALAYRRKSMSTYKGSRSPAQLHRQQKRLASYSPNKRYQNVQKLSITPASQRFKAHKPKASKHKRRKR
jgi:type IX secretion system PorP/SprF family membrane protein